MAEIWAGFLAFAYAAGSVVCHQLPARSFHLSGLQFPVCARCTGLYGGGLLGLILSHGMRRVPRTSAAVNRAQALAALALSTGPTALSLATEALGLWDPGNAGRAALALPLGLATGAVLAAVAGKDLR